MGRIPTGAPNPPCCEAEYLTFIVNASMIQNASIGLISAIDEEASGLAAGFVPSAVRVVAGRQFRVGRLEGREVVLVRAGIGKVNAALAATVLCAGFGCRALVMGGVAGGLDPALAIGDVVIGRRIVCHDYGAQRGGRFVLYQPGAPPLPETDPRCGYDLPRPLEDRLRRLFEGRPGPRVSFGTIASGDLLVSCVETGVRMHRELGARAVEMEGAAVAQIARRFAVPALVIRGISDLAGAEHGAEIRAHLRGAALAAAEVLRAALPALQPAMSE